MPDQIIDDLGLDLELESRIGRLLHPGRPRRHAHRPARGAHRGRQATAESFRDLTGSDREYDAWRGVLRRGPRVHRRRSPRPCSSRCGPLARSATWSTTQTWEYLVEQPLGQVIEQRFADDTVRGVVATDALIGTFADLNDRVARPEPLLPLPPDRQRHRASGGCPVGGMGAVTDSLAVAARNAGATIVTGAGVSGIESDGTEADGHLARRRRLARRRPATGCSPTWRPGCCRCCSARSRPSGPRAPSSRSTCSLDRLPRLRSGEPPAGRRSPARSTSPRTTASCRRPTPRRRPAQLPTMQPGELYCHSLTDPSILGPLAAKGMHTLTYFGVHTPARAFERRRAPLSATSRWSAPSTRSTSVLDEPIESLLAARQERRSLPGGQGARRTSTRPWRCRVGTSSTATWRGPGRPTGPGWTRPRSAGASPPTSRTCCCAARARDAAARSAASAATTRRRPCWTRCR